MPTLDYTTWMMLDGSDEWIEYVIPVEVSQDELTALSFNWHGKTTADTLGRMASIAHVTILADYWACACGDRAVRMVSTPNYFPNPASGPAVVEDLVPLPCCGSPKCRLQALRYTDTFLKTQHRDVKTEMPGSALPVSSFLNSFRSGQQYKCAHCGKEQGRDEAKKAGTMKRCGRCKAERYCDRDCQRSHWRSGHEQVCMAWRHAGGEGEGEGEGGGEAAAAPASMAQHGERSPCCTGWTASCSPTPLTTVCFWVWSWTFRRLPSVEDHVVCTVTLRGVSG